MPEGPPPRRASNDIGLEQDPPPDVVNSAQQPVAFRRMATLSA
jgi:hypothetical protein